MKTPRFLISSLAALALAGVVASCESPEAPSATDGKIVLRFEPGAGASMVAGTSPAAATFDSVVVNVFRPGATPTLEVSKGVAITNGDPIEVAVGCIAENGKKIGVNLYINHLLLYHGANTNVNVAANKATPVTVDTYAFYVSALTLTPPNIPEGAAFTLHWPPAAAAAKYRLEESVSLDFSGATTQSVIDTTIDVHVGLGSHYFRVRPMTPYALGLPTFPKFGYVTGGSGTLLVSDVTAAVIPGETITITGENLDYPNTQATIGTDTLAIQSASWGEIVARVPRTATTAKVTVSSGLGTDTSNQEVVVQRVAYVSATGEYATGYIALLTAIASTFGLSGVVAIPVTDLDTRDMSVFDIIMVANDTGTTRLNWGGGQPTRAAAILGSNANVLAIGKGGALFLSLVANDASVPTTTAVDADRAYFEADKGDSLFTTPKSVGGPDLSICKTASTSVALNIPGSPASVSLHASTGKTCNILGQCSPDGHWALADFRFNDPDGTPVVYFFWGYASDPGSLTSNGSDCLANIMNMLYKSVAPVN